MDFEEGGGAGDALPFCPSLGLVGVAAPLPAPLLRCICVRHCETISLARRGIDGSTPCAVLMRLMLLPMPVLRKSSSDGVTPFCRSRKRLTMLAVGSRACRALLMALALDTTSRSSMISLFWEDACDVGGSGMVAWETEIGSREGVSCGKSKPAKVGDYNDTTNAACCHLPSV